MYSNIEKEGGMQEEMEMQEEMKEENELVADSDFKQDEYDLNFNVSEMLSRINDIDEFNYFTENYRKLAATQGPQLKQMLYSDAFTAKHRDYLKIVLASKRIQVTIGPLKDKKKITSMEINEEERPGDRGLRENAKQMTTVVDDEDGEVTQMNVSRKFFKAKPRVQAFTQVTASSQPPPFLTTNQTNSTQSSQ
jgi:hypothetical protein